MRWNSEWRAIAGRISGIVSAGELLAQTFQANSEDPHGIAKSLGAQANEVANDLDSFRQRAHGSAPPKVIDSIGVFLDTHRMRMYDPGLRGVEKIRVSVVPLAWLKAEVEYHLMDFESVALRISERAFLHLQQLIVADDTVRAAWQSALDRGETACERLGGAHLLTHGIWAFKAHGLGARTDLVFVEPYGLGVTPERVADAMVLTEWKVLRRNYDVARVAEAARRQAETYGRGVLGGIELVTYRYIVIVSQKQNTAIPDVAHDGTVYRHINIAVAPDVPSRAA